MNPVTYEADYTEEHNRWTTFFRLILAIPWLIVLFIYTIGSLFVTVIAWFALLILARYPEWARNYNTGYLRYHVRVESWIGLQTDEWPPFGLGDDPSYPVRISVVPPGRQSRLKALFRIFLGIPALFVALAMGMLQAGAAFVSWLSIVFRGYKPRGAHDAFNYALTFSTRLYAYYGVTTQYFPVGGLLVDDYPPIGEEGPRRKAEKQGLPSGEPPVAQAPAPTETQQTPIPPPEPPPTQGQ